MKIACQEINLSKGGEMKDWQREFWCARCKTNLVFHAGGAVLCCCDAVDDDSETIPESWNLTIDDLREYREQEDTYK